MDAKCKNKNYKKLIIVLKEIQINGKTIQMEVNVKMSITT